MRRARDGQLGSGRTCWYLNPARAQDLLKYSAAYLLGSTACLSLMPPFSWPSGTQTREASKRASGGGGWSQCRSLRV